MKRGLDRSQRKGQIKFQLMERLFALKYILDKFGDEPEEFDESVLPASENRPNKLLKNGDINEEDYYNLVISMFVQNSKGRPRNIV